MSIEHATWLKAQPIWTRIVLSSAWKRGAKVLTPMHKLLERADSDFIFALFGEPVDPNNAPRWFEVLTLGFALRQWAAPEPLPSGGSSDVAAKSTHC